METELGKQALFLHSMEEGEIEREEKCSCVKNKVLSCGRNAKLPPIQSPSTVSFSNTTVSPTK